MAKNNGWWRLTLEGNEYSELSDIDREHISECIMNGYVQGQIIKDDEDDENEDS